MMRRELVAELLDSDSGSADEIRASLRDLDRINRWFGGVHTSARMLRRVATDAEGDRLTVLDVAAASSRVVELAAGQVGISVDVTRLDRAPSHLEGHAGVVGDALRLPFKDCAFDVVHSCLFLHHLRAPEAAVFLRDSLRVARCAVLVNDLRRSHLHWFSVKVASPILFSRITQHDGPASVKRAYTREELASIAEATGAKWEMKDSFLFRFAMILWKR
jgi:ubiquinone/menaquinone biosynthesis C-methylase UbiE